MHSNEFFASLWQVYTSVTPQALKIYQLFESFGETVVNDHVAFRTFANSPIELARLERVLDKLGYHPYGAFRFKSKHLLARCYKHTNEPDAPKIFLSELLVDELPTPCQKIVTHIIEQIPSDAIKGPDIFWQQRLWSLPSLDDYIILKEHSEYAAWLTTMGMQANHFTVSINHLKQFNSIDSVNQLLLEHGYTLNQAGGLIKGSPELYLQQSSTMADRIEVTFADQKKSMIPSCFYEFALRHQQPDGHLFDSFIEGNADKIFNSTNS